MVVEDRRGAHRSKARPVSNEIIVNRSTTSVERLPYLWEVAATSEATWISRGVFGFTVKETTE